MWDTLPPEIQEIILREKHIMEAEEMRPLFRNVLLELLEYSFATYRKRCDLYAEKYLPEIGFILVSNSDETCYMCNKPISTTTWSISYTREDKHATYIHGYKSLDGKSICCYKLEESVDAALRGERPPISPIEYDMDSVIEYIQELDINYYSIRETPSRWE